MTLTSLSLLLAATPAVATDWTRATDSLFLAPLFALAFLFWIHWMRTEW
jgi:hypothetical protein